MSYETYAKMAMIEANIKECDEGFSATHPHLRGVVAFGSDFPSCVEDFTSAVEAWAERKVQKGQELPRLDLAGKVRA